MKKIKLYGSMRSCTNYMGRLLKDHCDIELVAAPWKHGLPEKTEEADAYVFCLKNPYALWEGFTRGFEKGRVLHNHFVQCDDRWFTDKDVLEKLKKATKEKNGDVLEDEEILSIWVEKQNELYKEYLKFYTKNKEFSAIALHSDLLNYSKEIVEKLGQKFNLKAKRPKFNDVAHEVSTEQRVTNKKFDDEYYRHEMYMKDLEDWERTFITENIDWNLAKQFKFNPRPLPKNVTVRDYVNLVYYGDFGCHSGFGRVSDGILTNLPETWNIRALGINYAPGQKEERYGDNIQGFSLKYIDNNPYGPKEVMSYLNQTEFDYDMVFALQDPFVFDSPLTPDQKGPNKFLEHISEISHQKDAKLVSYFPIDTAMPNPNWFKTILKSSDRAVCYLDWAKKQVEKCVGDKVDTSNLDVIKHGCDNDKFYPLPEKVRKQGRKHLNIEDDEFLFFWLSANQRRKNIPRDVMGVFAKYYSEAKHKGLKPRLIMKTSINKSNQEGWDLNVIRQQLHRMYDIEPETIGFLDKHYSHQELNLLYNCADCVYLSSMEGHGLSVSEAYSARRPVITANHGALSELGDRGRSLQIDVPNTLHNKIWFTKDNNVPRSVIDIDDAVKKFDMMTNMSDTERSKIANTGYKWAQEHSWEAQAEKWKNLFEEVLLE